MAGPCPPLVLLLAAPLNSVNSVAGLCGWALSSSCPPLGRAPELCQLCGWAPWLGSVSRTLSTLSGSVAGLCVEVLSSFCSPLGHTPELSQLCGWALCPGLVLLLSSSCPRGALCPGLALLLSFFCPCPMNSVNSVAGLCGWALSSSCPPLGRTPELCQLCVLLLSSSSWPRP